MPSSGMILDFDTSSHLPIFTPFHLCYGSSRSYHTYLALMNDFVSVGGKRYPPVHQWCESLESASTLSYPGKLPSGSTEFRASV